jgi:hypothetical protein
VTFINHSEDQLTPIETSERIGQFETWLTFVRQLREANMKFSQIRSSECGFTAAEPGCETTINTIPICSTFDLESRSSTWWAKEKSLRLGGQVLASLLNHLTAVPSKMFCIGLPLINFKLRSPLRSLIIINGNVLYAEHKCAVTCCWLISGAFTRTGQAGHPMPCPAFLRIPSSAKHLGTTSTVLCFAFDKPF